MRTPLSRLTPPVILASPIVRFAKPGMLPALLVRIPLELAAERFPVGAVFRLFGPHFRVEGRAQCFERSLPGELNQRPIADEGVGLMWKTFAQLHEQLGGAGLAQPEFDVLGRRMAGVLQSVANSGMERRRVITSTRSPSTSGARQRK